LYCSLQFFIFGEEEEMKGLKFNSFEPSLEIPNAPTYFDHEVEEEIDKTIHLRLIVDKEFDLSILQNNRIKSLLWHSQISVLPPFLSHLHQCRLILPSLNVKDLTLLTRAISTCSWEIFQLHIQSLTDQSNESIVFTSKTLRLFQLAILESNENKFQLDLPTCKNLSVDVRGIALNFKTLPFLKHLHVGIRVILKSMASITNKLSTCILFTLPLQNKIPPCSKLYLIGNDCSQISTKVSADQLYTSKDVHAWKEIFFPFID